MAVVPIILAVVGSRGWTNQVALFSVLDAWVGEHGRPACIVSGGAKGADTFASYYAAARHVSFREFPADWTRGRRAGPERNERMLAEATHVIAFCCGDTPGTRNSISIAERRKLPLVVVNDEQ